MSMKYHVEVIDLGDLDDGDHAVWERWTPDLLTIEELRWRLEIHAEGFTEIEESPHDAAHPYRAQLDALDGNLDRMRFRLWAPPMTHTSFRSWFEAHRAWKSLALDRDERNDYDRLDHEERRAFFNLDLAEFWAERMLQGLEEDAPKASRAAVVAFYFGVVSPLEHRTDWLTGAFGADSFIRAFRGLYDTAQEATEAFWAAGKAQPGPEADLVVVNLGQYGYRGYASFVHDPLSRYSD